MGAGEPNSKSRERKKTKGQAIDRNETVTRHHPVKKIVKVVQAEMKEAVAEAQK